MYCLRILPILILAIVSYHIVQGQSKQEEPTDLCIGCICEAASRCNRTVGCHHEMCGMFRITKPYWLDAGSPTILRDDPGQPDAWVRCVTDPFCAGQTVFGYMNKYRKDCNGDGKITCDDFAYLHHLGGFGCGSRDLDSKYRQEFESCMRDSARG